MNEIEFSNIKNNPDYKPVTLHIQKNLIPKLKLKARENGKLFYAFINDVLEKEINQTEVTQ